MPGDAPQPGEKIHPARPILVHSLLGPILLKRRYYYDPAKPPGTCGRCPLDAALGLMGQCTPGLAKIATRATAQASYEEASADLAALAGIKLGARRLQRLTQSVGATLRETLKRLPAPAPDPAHPPAAIPVLYILADGTGIPMNKASLCGVKGRSPEGTARTREVKIGGVCTQTITDEEGRPVRDEDSTTWIAGFEQAVDFGLRLRDEAVRRGAARALRTVFLADGAVWLWEVARVNFPEALQILDFWHASEYLAAMARLVEVPNSEAFRARYARWRGELAASRLDTIVCEARSAAALVLTEGTPAAVEMAKHLAYLENNRTRMDYAAYRAEGLSIGSGVVEAGCKTVVGRRFKCSGMFWSEPGARNLLHIRAALLSQSRLDEFWGTRAAA